jgi:hypothetical protein
VIQIPTLRLPPVLADAPSLKCGTVFSALFTAARSAPQARDSFDITVPIGMSMT